MLSVKINNKSASRSNLRREKYLIGIFVLWPKWINTWFLNIFSICFLIAKIKSTTNVFGEKGVDKFDNNKKKSKEAAEYNRNSFVMSSRRAFDNNL